MKFSGCALLFNLYIIVCSAQAGIFQKKFQTVEGLSHSLWEQEVKTYVMIFLAPECPLCINYSLTLNQLHKEFGNNQIKFTGIFPGKHDTQEEVLNYIQQYNIPFTCLWDKEKHLSHFFEAGITPEVVVSDTEGNVLYKGRIDNWAYSLGKKRAVITRHDLKEVLEKRKSGIAFKPYQTQAIGCIIE